MASFGYPKHKQKTLRFTQHFGTQSSLWVKINLDPMLDEEDWIKSMYIETLPNKRKLKKNTMPIYKISSFDMVKDF
jgi:hypothetical protein